MKIPAIKTKVVHSATKDAWNVIGKSLGSKYKIAAVPYVRANNGEVLELQKQEAFEHALFISQCFNNADKLRPLIGEQ